MESVRAQQGLKAASFDIVSFCFFRYTVEETLELNSCFYPSLR